MNNGNGVNGDGVGSIGVAKVTTVHDPEYRVGDAAEAALLFNKSLLIIPGDGRYSGHWVITKVNERSVAVTSQIDDENNFKETEGVERNSVKFNLTFDQLKSLDVKILPGAFGAEACHGWQAGESRFVLKGPSTLADPQGGNTKRPMLFLTLWEKSPQEEQWKEVEQSYDVSSIDAVRAEYEPSESKTEEERASQICRLTTRAQ